MNDHTQEFKTIWSLIENASSIALCGHSSPDGDCLGSAFSLGTAIKQLGKSVRYFMPTETSGYYSFLPLYEQINKKQFDPSHFDLIISVDTSNPERSILADYSISRLHTPVILIDHHYGNSFSNEHRLVDSTISSCCELVYSLITWYDEQLINSDVATYILLGIMTDTGNFMRGCSPQTALRTAARLLELGAKKQRLVSNLFQSNSFEGVQFYSTLLQRVNTDPTNNVIRTYYTQSELQALGLDHDMVEGGFSIIRSVSHQGCFILFKLIDKPEDGTLPYIKCSFRTHSQQLNVSTIAGLFGGGGHKAASGARIMMENDYLSQINRIVSIVSEHVELQMTQSFNNQ